MFSSQSTEISLDAPCKTLAPVQADKIESRFFVGSSSLKQPNFLHVTRYHSEVNELGLDASIPHETGPVGSICSSPTDSSLVLTAAEQCSSAVLWKIPKHIVQESGGFDYDDDAERREDDGFDGGASSSANTMEQVASLENPGGASVTDIVWRDSTASCEASPSSTTPGDVLTMHQDGTLIQWDINFGTADSVRTVETSSLHNNSSRSGSSLKKKNSLLPRVVWDPHANGDAVAVTSGTSVHILDWRLDTSVPSGTVESFSCHRYGVTDLDYNPNKPYVLTTAGQDGLVKFWDLRSAKHPVLTARGGHSHWVSRVKYNPFHDQLVLSTGTDSLVNLWRVSTISSAPMLSLDDTEGNHLSQETATPNVCVARHEHGDSAYGLSWGAADAWIYMTVGYDGKAILNHVPSNEKYKILL